MLFFIFKFCILACFPRFSKFNLKLNFKQSPKYEILTINNTRAYTGETKTAKVQNGKFNVRHDLTSWRLNISIEDFIYKTWQTGHYATFKWISIQPILFFHFSYPVVKKFSQRSGTQYIVLFWKTVLHFYILMPSFH